MDGWQVPALAAAAYALAYLLLVAALVVAGRRSQAVAVARFVPDCAVLLRRLLRDPRVPRSSKALLAALALYLVTPFDLVPDVVPVVGQLDDAIVVLAVLRRVVRTTDPAVIAEHWPGPPGSLALLLRLIRPGGPDAS